MDSFKHCIGLRVLDCSWLWFYSIILICNKSLGVFTDELASIVKDSLCWFRVASLTSLFNKSETVLALLFFIFDTSNHPVARSMIVSAFRTRCLSIFLEIV